VALTEFQKTYEVEDGRDEAAQEAAPPDASSAVQEPDEGVKVSIIAGRNLGEASDDVANILVSIKTPAGSERQPSDLVCVIDTSGSMSTEATIQGASGATESHGLSLLDIAKHGVRTIIRTLTDKDRISLVSFERESRVVLPMTVMDADGQAKAEEALDTMTALGGTNLWEGVYRGLESLRESAEKGRLSHMMLLTDGETSYRDTVMPQLKNYREKYERLPGTITTFGFGYSLDSQLLTEIAEFGSGSYSFIPDAGFVGTAFVNCMSNLLVTMAREVYLTLGAENGAQIVDQTMHGGFPVEITGESICMNLGTLQYGQTKDVIVPMRIRDTSDCYLVASLRYETPSGAVVESVEPAEGLASEALGDASQVTQVEMQRCRCIFVDALCKAMSLANTAGKPRQEACHEAATYLQEAIKKVQASPASETEDTSALLEDMRGQSTEALSRLDWFDKWGRHYLPSVMFAHRLQQCNNFKDPGVQVYGGELYATLRDMADDAFNELPPPKKQTAQARWHIPAVAAHAAPVSMAAYNDRYCG